MNLINQQELLGFARKAIASHFSGKKYDLEFVSRALKEKRGVFVSLHKNGELRGCIGFIQPIKSIYDSVKENALNAAFHDPRFRPLSKEELPEITIEISVLSVPAKLEYKDENELIRKLKPKIDGIVLEKNGRQATFLPQVWEQIPDPFDFLRQLSWKAGLSIDAWKSADIYTYKVEKFEEKGKKVKV